MGAAKGNDRGKAGLRVRAASTAVVTVWVLVVTAGFAGRPGSVAVAGPKSGESVVKRETAGAIGPAIGATRDVSIGANKATLTYDAPGAKRSRRIAINYSELMRAAIPWRDPRALIFWVPLALTAVGLALRLVRLARRRPTARAQEATISMVDRRRGERRQDERRQGERRRDDPADGRVGPERRREERRRGERRRGDRRQAAVQLA